MKEQEFENGEELLKRKQQERLIRKGKKKQSFLRSLARFFTCIALVYFIYFCINQQGWYLTENAFSFKDESWGRCNMIFTQEERK